MILRAVHILCFAQAAAILVLFLLIAVYGGATFQEPRPWILGLEVCGMLGIGALATHVIIRG